MTKQPQRFMVFPHFRHGLLLLGLLIATSASHAQFQHAQPHGLLDGFLENHGQWPDDVQFGGQVGPLTVAVSQGAVAIWPTAARSGGGIRLELRDVLQTDAQWIGSDHLAGVRHFFIGNDPARWRTHLPAFGSMYLGEDATETVRVSQRGSSIELTLTIRQPGRAPSIRLDAPGATGMRLDTDGSIAVDLDSGRLKLLPPRIATHGSIDTVPITSAFVLRDSRTVDIMASTPGSDEPLTVTTALEWSTFVGGTEAEFAGPIVIEEGGAVLLAGQTHSPDFPTTNGAFDTTNGNPPSSIGLQDIFICKLTSGGTELEYATYLGGAASESLGDFRIDADGRATIVGRSTSPDFPTTPGAFMTTKLGPFGASDAIVTRLSADGSALVFSTFVGGEGPENVNGADILPDGSVIFCGSVSHPNYPDTSGGTIPGTGSNAFVTRLLADGSDLVFSEVFGGEQIDGAHAVSWHASGRIAVCGFTNSTDFPFTPGAFGTEPVGSFIAQFDDTTGQILAATALGGSKSDSAADVACDSMGNVYVAGFSNSPDYPTTADAFQPVLAPSLGAQDGVITCFDPTLSTVLHSTFLGGNLQDWITDLDVDPSGLVTVSGITNSAAFPVTVGAFDTQPASSVHDAFVSRFSRDLTALHYSSYLGGDGSENLTNGEGAQVDVAPDGRVAVAVGTGSADFPVTPGTLSTTLQGGADVAVAVLRLLPTGVATIGASTPGCSGPLVLGVTAMPKVGSEVFALNCTGAPPKSNRGLLLIALDSLAIPVKAAGIDLFLDPATLLAIVPVSSDAYGYAEVPLRVPADPAVAGMQAATQIVWRDPCAPSGPFSASNALAITLQP